jgi:hypothetical protein
MPKGTGKNAPAPQATGNMPAALKKYWESKKTTKKTPKKPGK